jgi:predicted kinase
MPPRARAPVTVIALQGPPGAGKSTLARALGQHLAWPLLDKDDLKDVLDGQTPHAGSLSYELLLRLVDRQVRQGLSVVCDSRLLARRKPRRCSLEDDPVR